MNEYINEAQYYTKMLLAQADIIEGRSSKESLVERQAMISGYSTRLQVSINNFIEEKYKIDLSDFDLEDDDPIPGTLTNTLLTLAEKIHFITFYLNNDAMELSIEELEKNLEEAAIIAKDFQLLIEGIEYGVDDLAMATNENCELTTEERIALVQKVIDRESDNDEAYASMAIIYYEIENYPSALQYFNKALEINNNWEYLFGAGVALYQLERYEEAWDYMKRAKLVNQDEPGIDIYLRKISQEIQESDGLTFTDRLDPYIEMCEKLKRLPNLSINSIVPTQAGKANLAATMAVIEDYDLLKRYCNEGHSLNITCSANFRYWEPTPLYMVCTNAAKAYMKDRSKMLHFLVNRGADPNMSAGDGSTPLWNICAGGGDFNLVKTLLELGADPNKLSSNNDGEDCTPLIRCMSPDIDEKENIISYGEDEIKKAIYLLLNGADPNLCNPAFPDFTPLMYAVSFGAGKDNIDLVELLIKKGADVNAVIPESEESILIMAVVNACGAKKQEKEFCHEIIKLLLENGANVNIIDKYEGKTAYDIAKENNESSICKLLIEYGANKTINQEPDNLPRVREIIKELKKDWDALLPRHASKKDIKTCNDDLDEEGYPPLPDEYAHFLQISNGLAWNGIELFGTDEAKEKENTYILEDIVNANLDFYYDEYYDEELSDNYLYIGREDEDYYIFNYLTNMYEIRDRCGNDVMEEFDNFEDFFLNTVGLRYHSTLQF